MKKIKIKSQDVDFLTHENYLCFVQLIFFNFDILLCSIILVFFFFEQAIILVLC